MLDLINGKPTKADVSPVSMGDKRVVQVHVDNSLAGCFSSHSGMDGTKPYRRYALAGGYQAKSENVFGHSVCARPEQGYAPIRSIDFEVRGTMEGLMASPTHRDNILDLIHRRFNLGIARDRYNTKVGQHFEGG